MNATANSPRRFFHSFPRPHPNESQDATLHKGLSILSAMRQHGLVLAPEVVIWKGLPNANDAGPFRILQRRISFTELSPTELPAHCSRFGPLALSVDISALREAGALPVIYIPQSINTSVLSTIGTFCVFGAFHTRYVLEQLNALKLLSDREHIHEQFERPVDADYTLNLINTAPTGEVAARYDIPASLVRDVFSYVGYRNIPFDHSAGLLQVFLNMFYPTDNTYSGDVLGYYRQREWRFVAGDFHINGQPIGRPLAESAINDLNSIDRRFWTTNLDVNGSPVERSKLALVYKPTSDWDIFKIVNAIFAPKSAVKKVRSIMGSQIPVFSIS